LTKAQAPARDHRLKLSPAIFTNDPGHPTTARATLLQSQLNETFAVLAGFFLAIMTRPNAASTSRVRRRLARLCAPQRKFHMSGVTDGHAE
jgi:hypothetical protein